MDKPESLESMLGLVTTAKVDGSQLLHLLHIVTLPRLYGLFMTRRFGEWHDAASKMVGVVLGAEWLARHRCQLATVMVLQMADIKQSVPPVSSKQCAVCVTRVTCQRKVLHFNVR